MARWNVGMVGWRRGVCCPQWLLRAPTGDGPDLMGAALMNDSTLYTPDGPDFLIARSFPGFIDLTADLELGVDINFPGGSFADESDLSSSLFFSIGFAAAGDGYFYAWVSNDIGEGQQAIARFDPSDLANPTVLYDHGVTDPADAFLYQTGLHWHPAAPDRLYAILVNVDDGGFPDYNTGEAWLFSVDLATGTRTNLIDLSTVASDVGGAFRFVGYMHEWDRGFVVPIPDQYTPALDGRYNGNWLAYDVVSDSWDQTFALETVQVAFGVVQHGGVNGLGQLLAADWSAGSPPDILNPLDFAAGGGLTPGTSTCEFRDGLDDYGFPQLWFAPPDRSAIYVSDTQEVWRTTC